MKKFLGITWAEWICTIVAVITAELAIDAFQPTGFWSFLLFIITWSIGYTISMLLIKQIIKWTEKN